MTTNSNFENLQFNQSINTIHSNDFPVNFSLHWHKYAEIIALPENTNIMNSPVIKINQKEYSLHPGDILCIWPGELHETIHNNEKNLIGLQFSTTLFNELPDFAPYLNIFRSFHHISLDNTPQLTEALMPYIHHIFSILDSQNSFKSIEALIALYEMFMHFGSYVNDTMLKETLSTLPGTKKSLEKINLACSYIAENCEQSLTLDSVSDYIGFSSYYFSRIFKQATNYSFIEYLTIQRVKRAQILLSDSSLAMTEVSYRSGFKSISTFNRVFHQYRGCAPREYRQYYSN